ncbi:MAG: efflux RND transporter periplasmic adaptor subunit [Bacteroidales bacterium]|nr:efflux RND transporter periplasmic adaptor subunit [Bacteroidales bacterium]
MKLNQILCIAGSLLLLGGVASCKKESKIVLQTTKVTTGSITKTVTATGTVESKTQVDVGTQVTGIIDKLYVDYNDVVTQGQLIAEIEKTLLDSELRSADATLESARLSYEYAKKNYERDKNLHDKQLISDYEFDTTKNTYQVAEQTYQKAQADRVKAAKNLNYAEIYSPIDGIVISREVEVGQTVVSSMNVANLYVIADLDNMRVIGDVDEADIGEVKVGQNVKFYVDAYPNDTFSGMVTQVRLNPTTESNVVTYEVVVDTPNPDHKLIPGLTANLTIYTVEETDVTVVPNAALRFTPEEYPNAKNLPTFDAEAATQPKEAGMGRLWAVDGNQLKPLNVKLGETGASNTQILSGAEVGQVVALSYEAASEVVEETTTERSPFAPGPPGSKKK